LPTNGRGEDPDLIAGQTRLSIEHLEHGVSLTAPVCFCSSGHRAYRTAMAGDVRLIAPRTEAGDVVRRIAVMCANECRDNALNSQSIVDVGG